MSGAPNPVVEAERDVQSARQRMMTTVGQIQGRLAPARLMSEAKSVTRERANALLDGGVTAAKARPATVAAIAVAFTAFLFRREIFTLLRGRKRRGADQTGTQGDAYDR